MIEIDQLKTAVATSKTYSEVARKVNRKGVPNIIRICNRNGIDVSHLVKREGSYAEKNCPVCNKLITGKKSFVDRATTCSYACSNKHFRTGPNNGNWKDDVYRTTCFHHHGKRCIICNESNIVEAHHYDENHNNNDPRNLVPLCPTHHQYWHSRYRDLIKKRVDDYVKAFSIKFVK
jgi:hypothetical protein